MAETIYASATARGRAGVAVIRVSGPEAFAICELLTGAAPKPRLSSLRNISWKGEHLDQALVLGFAQNASFTGEEVTEFQIHGGIAVVSAVLRAIGETGLARLAEAGEFTRRALDNGMLDLTQVEGLADLIDAETEAQRKQALRTLSGEIGKRVDHWRSRLIRAAALIEATIDFADEDVPVDVVPEVKQILTDLVAEFSREIVSVSAAERIRDGFEVAIIGAPNAGKSTLLNRLAGREAAITSEIAGTTRDVIEVRMDLDGLAVTLLDTAGLRESDDPIEQEGIRRALQRAEAADLRLFLGQPLNVIKPLPEDLILHAKSDIGGVAQGLAVSGLTGDGVDELLRQVSRILSAKVANAGILVRERHRQALRQGVEAVQLVLSRLDAGFLPELVAEDLRGAVRALDVLVGRVDVEDLLGEIFSSFCIGK
ncbi:tRNA uridine-5-carboxymethylaminomethyl(34) synthesis GTPase MnmE [Xinfangfangia sp. D13-10-4-6]|uniref:tRNA uridine-5-carboxymethylaminomethyl(34) synthesis GTPase MnmE n=1 Tax=Pseudogemmobacter hezensis TaxID=2737662 RepID=UPI0015537277|nr:tRNA uridine-5-carboxymethylaminomethyl(34) synthesis GTPase MnmE [Pseudogemmobacter hezensis]NPD17364.1 tRNA uridine-5-carboxymethylaminomethyl(34) synthesis GTPase MnmE [Pseudogemmobacter hezensis]